MLEKNKTCQAFWEYDNIISSLYMLDFVDSPLLRKNVQTALNRGESYHQLRRAVSYANFGKLRFRSERFNSSGMSVADWSLTASFTTI